MAVLSFDDLMPAQGATPPPAPADQSQADPNVPPGFGGLVVRLGPATKAPAAARPGPAGTFPAAPDDQTGYAGGGMNFGDLVPKKGAPQQPQAQPPSPPIVAPTAPGTPGGAWEAGASGVGQGLTLNWGPELSGLVQAGMPPDAGFLTPTGPIMGAARMAGESWLPSVFGDPTAQGSATQRYQQAVEEQRARLAAEQAAHPYAFAGGELAGGVGGALAMPALAPLKAAEIATLPKLAQPVASAANLAVPGLAYGAAAGAGASPQDRIGGAVTGGGIGAVAGPVIGGGVSAIRSFLPSQAGNQAMALIQRAAQRDGIDLASAIAQMKAAQAAGQDVTLADLGGANMRGLVDRMARLPSDVQTQVRNFVTGRVLGDQGAGATAIPATAQPGAPVQPTGAGAGTSQAERLQGVVGDTLAGGRGSLGAADAIIAKRAAEAEPAYRAADANKIDYNSPAGQTLTNLLQNVPRTAYRDANQIIAATPGGRGYQLHIQMQPVAGGGYTPKLMTQPDVWQWRQLRRGLDTAMRRDRATTPDNRLTPVGETWNRLRHAIDKALGEAVPEVKAADAKFASDSKMLDALRKGQKAFNPSATVERVEREFNALKTAGEQELYRLGAANALREKLGAATTDRTRSLAAGNNAAKIKILAKDAAAHAEFTDFLKRERSMAEMKQHIHGSQTVQRLAEDADEEAGVKALEYMAKAAKRRSITTAAFTGAGALVGHPALGYMVGQAAGGKLGPLIEGAWRAMSKVRPANRANVLAAMRDVVLNPNPDTVRAFADRVNGANLKPATRRTLIGAVMNSLPRGAQPAIEGRRQ